MVPVNLSELTWQSEKRQEKKAKLIKKKTDNILLHKSYVHDFYETKDVPRQKP